MVKAVAEARGWPHRLHGLNRHLFVAENLALPRSLDDERVDLIWIDPQFARGTCLPGNQLTESNQAHNSLRQHESTHRR